MSHLPRPSPGQRWRSVIDGHTVVTGDAQGDTYWIRYDGTHLATAIDHANFFEDYEVRRDRRVGLVADGRRVDVIEFRCHPDVLSIELNVEVVHTAPGWSVVSTVDGRMFSRHATRAQAEYAARQLGIRASAHPEQQPR